MHTDQSCSKCVNHHLAEGRGRALCWRDQGAWRERNETSLSAASCLEPGGKKQPVRANQSPAGSVLNIKNQAIMNWWIDFVGQRAELPEFQQRKQQSVPNESLLEMYIDRLHKSSKSSALSLWNDQKIAVQCLTLFDHYFIIHYRTVPPRCYLFLAVSLRCQTVHWQLNQSYSNSLSTK